ncbi:MAG: DUF5916 domain-containing protein [bacterium]|nr:DUF5916 domain-containing protein [bacterium]
MILILAFIAPLHAREGVIQASPTLTPPKIDGRLDDPVWQKADAQSAFFQREPIEGKPATEKTEVRLLYDGDNLYVGFRCFDTQPEKIIANRMRRDAELDENDSVILVLDTYNDGRGGFFFSTNPLGAQWDILLSDEGRSRNEAWDCVWSCRASRDAKGWTAEMAIPWDQLRYAESEDAVWGINLGRIIRRKNEDVYLVPPPQAYGFGGEYRTSKLGTLQGLGALKTKPRLQAKPYTLSGGVKDFEVLDPTLERILDTGLDFKYGLTPGLTLDLSYKTDFAQVEVDQEQVNLTRFSIFFPEKRGFFLEGAGIFSFGERVQRFGGTPPTLLFYSRRIGIQEGHNIPVIVGSKFTGRAGPYEIGALHVLTDPKTFFDEEKEDRFLTDRGDLLEEDDPRLALATLLDTLEVTVFDTVRALRTNFSVFRVRRDIFARSSIGLIATNRSPGEDTDHNRSFGADLNLSFLNSRMNLRGFLAKTWSPDLQGQDQAGMAELGYRTRTLDVRMSYLDVQENFNPEVGFVPRDDMRRIRSSIRYRPRPNTRHVRQMSIGPRLTYLMDQNNILQTRQFEWSSFLNLQTDDWIGFRYNHRFERLTEPFDIHEGIEIPEGVYRFHSLGFNLFSNGGRKLSGSIFYEIGEFFNGTRNRLSASGAWKINGRVTLETDYGLNRVSLPNGNFLTNRITNRFLYSFTPDLFVRGLIQWNSKREVVGSNFLLNYRYRPGSDLFLVYNHAWETEGSLHQLNRSIQLKLSYFWKL